MRNNAVQQQHRAKQIVIPEDDVDPFEAEELEAERAAKKLMLENLSRTELIQRRREKDAKDKERNRRRQEWKDSRLQRANQLKALQVCVRVCVLCPRVCCACVQCVYVCA